MHMPLYLAVGKHSHVLVTSDASGSIPIPNSQAGVLKILESAANAKTNEVITVGNRRWLLPLASALRETGISVGYIPIYSERGKRGKRGSMENTVRTLLAQGNVRVRPYFHEVVPPEDPLGYRIVLTYLEYANRVRKQKHHLLDGLCLLFPEVVRDKTAKEAGETKTPQPPEIFDSKKMASTLADPRPERVLMSGAPVMVRELARTSIGLAVDPAIREKSWQDYSEAYAVYRDAVTAKEQAMNQLRAIASSHVLVQRFGGGDVITVLAALLGDKVFGEWRHLRHFAGLDVTRMDATGKRHISRVRGPVRQYLYLFAALTKVGKEMGKEIREAAKARALEAGKKRATHLTVKVIEGVLKRLRKEAIAEATRAKVAA
jgi:hypothetical protein